MKDKKATIISSIGFILLGLLLFIKPDFIVKFIAGGFGIILLAIGLYKLLKYITKKGIILKDDLYIGITSIVLGILLICLNGVVEFLLRFFIGGWIILMGLSKLLSSFNFKNDNKKFVSLLVTSLILIGIGLYIVLVSNLAFSIMGLFMVLYGVLELITYFSVPKVETTQIVRVEIQEAEVVEKED